jgi:choline dehydrogenase-like flavoprotein
MGSTLMARSLPRKDVVIVGLGWTGSIMAYELARTGLEVVAIERGPWRDTATDFNIGTAPDELRYGVRHDVFLRPKQETLTMRNNPSQTALPIRRWGSFLPGNGVGGAGVHWNGQTWRFLPDDFRIRSHTIERYGEGIMPEGNHIQDWPVSYDELEPYYDKFEYLAGISGKAGNLKGKIQARADEIIRRRRCGRAMPRTCSPRQPPVSACIRSRVRPAIFPPPTPTLTDAAWRPAPIAVSASVSAAPIIPRPRRRPACCRRWCASRPSRRAPNAKSPR